MSDLVGNPKDRFSNDAVVPKLLFRQTLEEETETLMRDINFLQGCLDDEATFRAESVGTLSREPTLTGS